jgi:protein TonB
MKQTAQKPAPQVAEVRRVETKPIVQAAQAIERPTTQPVTRETAAVQAEPPAPVVTQSVGAVATMSRTAEVVTKNAPAAAERTAVAREATAREATVREATAVATTPVTATATEAPAITQTVQHAAVHRSIAQETPVTQAIEHAPVQDSPIQEAKLRQDMPVHSMKPVEAQQFAPQPIVAEKAPAHAAPARKGDDRWLAEALIRRVNELQRYPTSARKNGWEGKVLLRVVIGADGHLAEVKVEQSSGYEALDNAAIETVRLACPIHLRHELTRPRVVFNIPLKYDLTN